VTAAGIGRARGAPAVSSTTMIRAPMMTTRCGQGSDRAAGADLQHHWRRGRGARCPAVARCCTVDRQARRVPDTSWAGWLVC
jgi:hypothetical protein